ncbi:DUF2254 domain-containing protein [Hwangdonia lutea]|uniref:DUF2254 domain-containing protein n=1 Tax=Hwangdonia lutea TaxID=3075823 RepID=A0AA97EQU4_9FLAO|nr:DUF2254 domain-containing protein [Hwangdonia sp. SCSIO 19198]WOD44530.1 DUF2254 domain-containing protein [Hwangdonia sp. SCSIO 19198]
MKNYLYNVINYLVKLESKIAFYPTLMSLGGLFFAFIMYYLESLGISSYLIEHAPLLVVNDTETARSLLTTFVAGLISIMVFSFSLVMILLNQASSNFSPRVLPGLISNRRHQVILGIYISSILYSIFTLVAIEPNGNEYQLPGFSVLLAIVFMTVCLGAFIYFIHSISQAIQVNNILDKIFSTAITRLETLIDAEKESKTDFPDTSNWQVLKSHKSGYFQDLSSNNLINIAKENQCKIEVIPVKGTYVLKGAPIVKYSIDLDEDFVKQIAASFLYSKSELIEDNYVLAFKQITEIALKAMSPGINDPGTAINAIDYLTDLFLLRMHKNDRSCYFYENMPIVKIGTVTFSELLYSVMAALRTYCKHDFVIVTKLFGMLKHLLENQTKYSEQYKKPILQEVENLYQDTIKTHSNSTDLKRIEFLYNELI